MREIGISFGIGAVIGAGFSKSFSVASKGVGGLSKEIVELQKNQKLLKDYGEDKKALLAKAEAIKKTRLAITELKKSMKDEKNQTEDNAKALNNLEKRLVSLNNSYSTESKRVRETAKILKEKRIDLNDTAKSYKKLSEEIERATKASQKYGKAKSAKVLAGKVSKVGGTALKAGMAGAAILYKPIQQAIKAESDFADVKKQFDFDTKEEEDKFKKELHKIITEKKIAIGLDELYAAAANAGQSGLNKEEAVQYIELASKIGMAFDMNREEAAKAMFEMKNALNLPYEGLVELTDKMNYLGNTTGASAASITDFVNRVGNIGKLAGFSAGQVAAIGASLIEQGMDADIAATGAKKVFGAMTKGSAVTKNQGKVYKSLGIDPVELAKLAQKDAQKAMNLLFEKINKKSAHEQGAIMTLLFGEEGKRGAAAIAANINKLNENLGKVNGDASIGSVDKEADVKRDTTENQIAILTGKLAIAGSQLGTLLLPEVNKIVTAFSNVLSKIIEFQQTNPEGFKKMLNLFKWGIGIALGFGGTLKVVSAGINAYSGYMKFAGWATEHNLIGKMTVAGGKVLGFGKTLVGVIGSVSKAFISFGVSLLTNPITWIIGAIVGLVAVGYLLYKNWDTVKKKASELKDAVVGLVDKYWFLLGPLGWIVKSGMTIYRNWDTIKEKAGELKEKIVEMISNIVLKWENFKAASKEILGNVFKWMEDKWNNIKEIGGSVADFFLGVFDKIKSGFDTVVGWGKKLLFLGSDEEKAPTSRGGTATQGVKATYGSRGKIQKYATGGIVSSPTLAWVGEGNDAETIIPHNKTQRSLNLWEQTGKLIGASRDTENNSSTYNFNFSPVINSNSNDSQNIESILKKAKDNAFSEFKNMMSRYERENKRRGYGR